MSFMVPFLKIWFASLAAKSTSLPSLLSIDPFMIYGIFSEVAMLILAMYTKIYHQQHGEGCFLRDFLVVMETFCSISPSQFEKPYVVLAVGQNSYNRHCNG